MDEVWSREEIGARTGARGVKIAVERGGDSREGLLSILSGGYGRREAVRVQGS